MKYIAFYLPQYHCIPENDEWWGEGFTEWTTVKKAKALFKGHNQPEIPLNENYYNLLEPEVQRWQAELAKQYGIYGFCYYHYWFNGKLLLEKPMENMLNNDDIDLPFCVCWANESWARTWDGQDSQILIQQVYKHDESSWKEHFEYLYPFFKDKRYIKCDNKPVLIIYKPQLIHSFIPMMKFWNKMAIDKGFNGIFWGFQHPTAFNYEKVIDIFDFGIEFEPLYTTKEIDGERSELNRKQKLLYGIKNPKWMLKKVNQFLHHMPNMHSYDEVWKHILARKPISSKIMPGAFPSWDNTPRKGKHGIVYYGATPEKFTEYLQERVKSASRNYHTEYLFINAWNEWGEGAHLEPDIINKMGYLEAVKKSLSSVEEV